MGKIVLVQTLCTVITVAGA